MEKVTSNICKTKDIGTYGNLFGGVMLAWVDEAAGIYAMKKTGEKHMVTLRFGEVLFRKPVKVGDIVEFYCGNGKVGNSSFSFDIKAVVDGIDVFSTDCTLVALDSEGRPKTIDQK
ncbi:MAG: hypothetical protein A2020_12425 [Lentisphaerae bacterium GWF2_45_14]|nr:MAG: hypothetical protein A2020_12425 [Lentisphaerae bacterium GWF2_45_14]